MNIINIPNILSLSRIILTPIFILLIYQRTHSQLILFTLFLSILITDILDGYIARKTNTTTITGTKLDLIADLIYVLGVHSALAYRSLVPTWFIVILVLSFTIFTITSKHRQQQGKSIFDFIGRSAAIITMLLPVLYIVGLTEMLFIGVYIVSGMFFIACIFKIRMCCKP